VTHSPTYIISIHLGASTLSLLVGQERNGEYEFIDYLEQPIPLARDVFRSQRIKRDTIERCVDILERFQHALQELGLSMSEVTIAAATNILSEAKNYHLVLNRLAVSSGLHFTILDNGGMTRLIYRKIERHWGETQGKAMAIHVGPGNTRVLLIHNGRVERYSSYRMGGHRTAESLHQTSQGGQAYLKMIRAHCAPLISDILHDYRKEEVRSVLLIGPELQRVERENPSLRLSGGRETFRQTLNHCALLSEGERLDALHLDFHSEDALLPALQINLSLLDALEVEDYTIPTSDYDQGLMMDLPITQKESGHFCAESLHTARLMAARYHADQRHYEQVLRLVESLFQQTTEIHQLCEWELFLLQMATILHEVGGFIGPRMHHKHSYYLISNSDIFGLDQSSLEIIALVARYHRHSAPKRSHKEYRALSREHQVLVSKLSALLRVADALDVMQQQRVQELLVVQRKEQLYLEAVTEGELELEQIALRRKGDLFETLFGLDLTLHRSTTL